MSLQTSVTRLFSVEHPIVLAPMGGAAGGALAAAVSNGGGLGLVGGGRADPGWLDRELAIAAAGTDRPWGVGFLSWAVGPDMIERALAYRPHAVMLSFGDPRRLAEPVKQAGVPLVIQVTDLDEARQAIEVGADVIVAQGAEAGGHGGGRATLPFVPVVVDFAAPTPVLAAGGIADGRGLAAALALGAAGVWCGSVWLCSEEDVAVQAIKDKFVAAASSDTLRSPTRTGKPARQLRTAWHEEWLRPGSPAPLPMPLQPMLVNEAWQRIDAAAEAGHEGALRLESFFVGQVVGSFAEVRPAAEITRQIVAECEQRIRELGDLL